MSNRNVEHCYQQHRRKIHRRTRQIEAVDYFNVLTSPEWLEKTEALLPAHRERLYPPTVTLSMFMKQALSQDRSCQRAVNAWAAQRTAEGLVTQSIRTGAYCRARQRLPVEMIRTLAQESGRILSAQAQHGWRWRGRAVKLADGTTISMPDTPENQADYPHPNIKSSEIGFPVIRLVALICLSTGAVLNASTSPYWGQGHSEAGLFRDLLGTLHANDVLLADSYYCSYWVIATLQTAGVDFLFEQSGSRITDFRCGRTIAKHDHIVYLQKPNTRPPWMTREQFAAFPKQVTVREVKVNGRVLVTNMTDHREIQKDELSKLYTMRWNVELDLRNIKTTLGMGVLSCLSPQMILRELWVYLLAYNLIRFLMAQAAHTAGMFPREISFKHTLQMWTEWISRSLVGRATIQSDLFRLITLVPVGHRSGRIEPRARKRRPKCYQWLKVPRHQARRQVRLLGYLPNPSS